MSEPYVGEIRMVGFTFAPQGWAFCDGSLLDISQNDTLYALLGTTYGGDGVNTFALPNLCGRLPMHAGNGHTLGEMAGVEAVTLNTNQLPAHTHPLGCAPGAGTQGNPLGNVWAAAAAANLYSNAAPGVSFNAATVGAAGGSQPHDNMSPFLVLNFIIALQGIYPSQS